ncbi:hypothetical protein [Streptomyces thermoviolaceus]|uniref:Integral membrane protein n=1 Tax=Streptomyces thermoviolaceus subsp. thermoviolaceus TaxID=66860 RepID=A0ABX0YR43_STRTL|nr:hypothetical protein [Streptomyces thermoviolaceus]NJP14553.1 hypothetical protein [Streptomyces thermoviolaceus subsp. thermoviolaceus]WTD47901.1 hypothetical protein OG899_10385 [Streptomyces thermoviolaceus]GGV74428.1 hypothetical protein GCM10010499_29050 [Streptomyces thermoviolaceus subsp. apingens]GHA94348.1 hypothetical protein GCM10010512_27380 [Streptomyces thermoviolaceus subsp. thermoviolaceus]
MTAQATFSTLADTFTPGSDADFLLGVLSWCASAAGVAGVLITGMLMALQLRHGEMGEGASYMRGLFFVMLGCILATTAGPIVKFLGPLTL